MAWRLTLSFAAGSIIFLRSPTGPLCRARRTKNHSPAPTLQSWHAASSRRSQARTSLSPHRQRPPAFQQLVAPLLDLVRLSADCMQSLAGKRWTSKSCASSIRVFSPLIAPTATLALKAGLWFRRGRLVMVFSSLAASCCCYAENPPIPAVQFSRTTSLRLTHSLASFPLRSTPWPRPAEPVPDVKPGIGRPSHKQSQSIVRPAR